MAPPCPPPAPPPPPGEAITAAGGAARRGFEGRTGASDYPSVCAVGMAGQLG